LALGEVERVLTASLRPQDGGCHPGTF